MINKTFNQIFAYITALLLSSNICVWADGNYSIVINEIVASNSRTIADEDGDYSDWIELYNYGNESINLEGWGLSDNEETPFKWTFPATIIKPGEFLVIWTSGKNRTPLVNELVNGIKNDVYLNIAGESVDDLLNHASFPNRPSYQTIVSDKFEAPTNIDDEYGQRLYGLIKAPTSGNYLFWISSDDNSRLFLSTDENPLNSSLKAEVPEWTNNLEWDKYPSQRSSEIYLEQDNYYYIEAIMKEGAGGDNLAVGWQLPNGTRQRPIPASHLFVKSFNLHTNFSISASGEPIILSHPTEGVVHYVTETTIPTDFSFGLNTDRTKFQFFTKPTPGSENSSAGFSQIINEMPVVSHSGGFYSAPIELTISGSLDGAQIIYTLDGSEPDINNINGKTYKYKTQYPSGSLLSREMETFEYQAPLMIKDKSSQNYGIAGINFEFTTNPRLPISNIFKGTVVRAKLYKEDALSINTTTNTYFISESGHNRYNLPVVSLVANEDDLFDYEKGIYVPGAIADNWNSSNLGQEWNGSLPANYNQRGSDWEIPAHFEFFPGSAEPTYSHNIGIRGHGGWSRAFYCKSLRLYARNSYGTNNTFDFPFFGDLNTKAGDDRKVQSFRRLILRNSGNDHYNTFFRDALMQELVSHLPFATQAYQPVVHFINGEYWGIINMRERYDEYYLASHFGVNPDDVAILNAWGGVETGNTDDSEQFNSILAYAESNNTSQATHYNWIVERVDVESLAQYYAAQIYFYNTDWPQNNMTFWRNRTGVYSKNAPSGFDGRWRWMLYDTDFGMNLYGNNHSLNALSRVMSNSTIDPSSRLFRRLMLNNEFKNRFINIVADQLNSCFHPEYIKTKLSEFNNRLYNSRAEHYNRWRSGNSEGPEIVTFAERRPTNVLNHTRSQFNISGTFSLTIVREGGDGLVKVNSILIDENMPGIGNPQTPYPWNGTYFANIPVSLKAIDVPGYRFIKWTGVAGVNENSKEISLIISSNSTATAVFEKIPEPELIHYWHFNNLPEEELAPFTSDLSATEEPAIISYIGSGNGYMDRVNEGSILNARNETPAERGLRVRNPSNTRDLILELPSTGYENLVLKYAVTRTSNGATQQSVSYRISNQEQWETHFNDIEILENYQIITINFTDIIRANDNPTFQVKISFTDENAAGNSGNNRFDNLTLEGFKITTQIPDSSKVDEETSIFPNPVRDKLNVICAEEIKEISLFDMNGKTLLRENPLSNKCILNMSALPFGIYLLSIQTETTLINKKIAVY